MSETTIAKEIKNLYDAAQRVNENEKSLANLEGASREEIDKIIDKMSHGVELTKNRGENIISRMKAGIISQDVAKKQMKTLLNDQAAQVLGILLRAGGYKSDLSVTEEDIKEAVQKINQQLS